MEKKGQMKKDPSDAPHLKGGKFWDKDAVSRFGGEILDGERMFWASTDEKVA